MVRMPPSSCRSVLIISQVLSVTVSIRLSNDRTHADECRRVLLVGSRQHLRPILRSVHSRLLGTANLTNLQGVFFAAEVLCGISTISQLDDSSTQLAIDALYSGEHLSRAIVQNSEFFPSGTRSYTNVTLTGISSSCGEVKAKRSTAPYSTSLRETTYAVQRFNNGTCQAEGEYCLGEHQGGGWACHA